jgi:hypothetical protein
MRGETNDQVGLLKQLGVTLAAAELKFELSVCSGNSSSVGSCEQAYVGAGPSSHRAGVVVVAEEDLGGMVVEAIIKGFEEFYRFPVMCLSRHRRLILPEPVDG